ncbi:aminoglycoside phosphotransferase [Paenibacillus sp. FSL R5-0345]|uniref:aminoglycoside phosphotransferase family protein n=1 Tax=Paenibacillus sp. FSL R5-0345 TaxID=1536770 RepID=UPI0004F6DB6A|nr:aminoglycoside phosphotransferase family protein [Paenibacillus sp. FSL R5-0345]AIQ37631.1 aminoglycoside phosphotransferase [Paenibacillus sp. FSL R5-0345]
MTHEEVLEGGNMNRIVRRENTVLRPTGSWSPCVHELLQHLEEQNFEGAPKFLGTDDLEYEILTFILGDVSGNKYPELEPYMWSDETLVSLAQILRNYHDATAGFNLKSENKWQLSYSDEGQHEVICHNDAALYNVVFQQGLPVALIDFDMAGPGPRIWDIAYTLYTSVPLASFAPDYSSGKTTLYRSDLHAVERSRRIHLFFESYGAPIPKELQQWIIQRLTTLCDTLRNGAADGNPAYLTMVEEGHLMHYQREIEFVSDNFEDWIRN